MSPVYTLRKGGKRKAWLAGGEEKGDGEAAYVVLCASTRARTGPAATRSLIVSGCSRSTRMSNGPNAIMSGYSLTPAGEHFGALDRFDSA